MATIAGFGDAALSSYETFMSELRGGESFAIGELYDDVCKAGVPEEVIFQNISQDDIDAFNRKASVQVQAGISFAMCRNCKSLGKRGWEFGEMRIASEGIQKIAGLFRKYNPSAQEEEGKNFEPLNPTEKTKLAKILGLDVGDVRGLRVVDKDTCDLYLGVNIDVMKAMDVFDRVVKFGSPSATMVGTKMGPKILGVSRQGIVSAIMQDHFSKALGNLGTVISIRFDPDGPTRANK